MENDTKSLTWISFTMIKELFWNYSRVRLSFSLDWRKTKVVVQLVRFIHHKTRGSKELAKTKIVAPNLEI